MTATPIFKLDDSVYRRVGRRPPRTVLYNPMDNRHVMGFKALIRDQAAAHGERIKVNLPQMAREINREFTVRLLFDRFDDKVVGMTTTTEALSPVGPVTQLEDLVVLKRERKKGFGRELMSAVLMSSFNGGKKGVTWDTGVGNEDAQKLYRKIDPAYNVNGPPAWFLPDTAVNNLGLIQGGAPLAENEHTTLISRSLGNPPNFDVGLVGQRISEQARVVGKDYRTQEQDLARWFILAARDGSMAIVSEAYSTFEGKVRADARISLSSTWRQNKNWRGENLISLIKGAAREINGRARWTGAAMHVELSGDVPFVPSTGLFAAPSADGAEIDPLVRDKAETLKKAFGRIGGHVLQHAGYNMVTYTCAGPNLLRALEGIVPEHGCSLLSQKRLYEFRRKLSQLNREEAAQKRKMLYGNGRPVSPPRSKMPALTPFP